MRSSRRSDVDAFLVMDVVEAARRAEASGRTIVHMEVGQPGTPAPEGARAALAARLDDDALGYTTTLGLPALRARIARLYRDWYGVDLNPDRVVVTPAASGAFLLAFAAYFDAGDTVGVGVPGYPSYRHILKAMSVAPRLIRTRAENRFQLTGDDLKPDLDGVIVASPSNPTGTMLGRSDLQTLIGQCHDRGITFISDEIYHGIEYDKKSVSALEISDDVCVINSFSKYFSMTGWRVGWMIVPESDVRRIERLAQNMFVCATHAAQVTALAAMDCQEELRANLAVYRANRALMLGGLPAAGFDRIAPPDGAFYVYADVSERCEDSRVLARDILQKAGVAVTPGLDFDPDQGGRFLRFSYARTTAEIRDGLARLKWYFRGQG